MSRARQSRGANVSFFAFQDIITAVTGILILIVILMVLMIRQPGIVPEVTPAPTETRSLEEIETLITKALEKIRELALQSTPPADATEASLTAEIATLEAKLNEQVDPVRAALLADVEAAIGEVEALKSNLAELENRKSELAESLKKTQVIARSRASIVDEHRKGDQVWLRMDPSEKEPIIVELDHLGAVLRDSLDSNVAKRIPTASMESELQQIAQGLDGLESYFVFFIRPSGASLLAPLRTMLMDEGIDLGYRPLGEEIELKLYNPEAAVFDE